MQHIANKVLNICNGDYIIRLDADDWLNENALLLLVNKAQSSKKIGAVFGNFLFANEKSKIVGYDLKLTSKILKKITLLHLMALAHCLIQMN